ncbi:uncharacterized protein [Musca autumnalis]|uniref:uncharacterized protein n=1 Tax=Musca autumnalis TaxID=221902 RepID=UPI003CF9CF06
MQLAVGHRASVRYCVANKFLVLFLLTILQVHTSTAQRSCYRCEGINCLRSTYELVETCSNGVDICVTVYDGATIQAQGCLENLPENLRKKCKSDGDDDASLRECHKCNDNFCNKWAPTGFECIQCDSISDSKCANNPDAIQPTRCPISRTANMYCYAAKNGDRVSRGCASSLQEQRSCLSSNECEICNPSELNSCNNVKVDAGSNPSGNATTTTTTTPKPNPNPSAGSVIEFSVANCWVILFAYLCKFLL